MKADGVTIKKVKCPYCGHGQNIFYKKGARCSGLFFKCKNRDCRQEFEIRLYQPFVPLCRRLYKGR